MAGTNYTTVTTQLKNTAWGKKSDGSVKPMFDNATSFHSSLFNGTTYILDRSDVTAYTIAVTGEDTISRVNLDSNYEVSSLTYSNSGDGTVLQKAPVMAFQIILILVQIILALFRIPQSSLESNQLSHLKLG